MRHRRPGVDGLRGCRAQGVGVGSAIHHRTGFEAQAQRAFGVGAGRHHHAVAGPGASHRAHRAVGDGEVISAQSRDGFAEAQRVGDAGAGRAGRIIGKAHRRGRGVGGRRRGEVVRAGA